MVRAFAISFVAAMGLIAAGRGQDNKPVLNEPAPLYKARPFTEKKSFTPGIEGPACDRDGNVYLVSYKKAESIGKVDPEGRITAFVTLPDKSAGNGIVFNPEGTAMFVADYVEHKVWRIDMNSKKMEVLC